MVYMLGDSFRHDIPAHGGAIHEGAVGYPNFINPLLSTTDTGRDLSYLIYSGLMRINNEGKLSPDIAESYTVSDDGKTYTFKLREGARFHDDTPLTSADVIFTIEKVKDGRVKSPYASNWQGVQAKAIDDHTVEFTLKTPYAPFLENTTLGILPKHIWEKADVDQFVFSPYNFDPVGSGPYQVKEVTRNPDGSVKLYHLESFKKYAAGEKYISTIYFHVYPDTTALLNALKRGEIQGAGGIVAEDIASLGDKKDNLETADLLRVFGVFFNQNQATIFADKDVRTALNMAVDKKAVVDKVMSSYANVEDSPLPGLTPPDEAGKDYSGEATSYLEGKGWKKNADGIMEKKDSKGTVKLSFTLATSDNPELVKTAELLKEQWSRIGAEVNISTNKLDELSQNVIRPRKYDALLFGEVTGRGDDLYPFWYSGERKDPGLNIALYTNAKADALLEKARTATTSDAATQDLADFVGIVKDDVPAVFLYSPDYLYVAPKQLKGLKLPSLEFGHERWAGILSSYINVRRAW